MGRKNACPMCGHWHIHSRPCDKAIDCECPGTKAWYDWAAVYWVMKLNGSRSRTGEFAWHARVGRDLTWPEKLDVARRCVNAGGGFQEIENLMGSSWRTIKKLLDEIEGASAPTSVLAAV